ncbi:MAG: hypothetical protein KAI83_19655 [Thiomargarita sp.]|nr:hypothetical protein [Thiomargarita sp.]MCK5685835.1 hypothetical protein [bacterium]
MTLYTQSITINIAPDKLYDFLSRPENLPKWAIFCHDISLQGNDWIATTDFGDAKIRFNTDANLGVIDFYISKTPGIEMPSYSRILPNENGSEYLFMHFRPSDIPADVYEKKVVGQIEQELSDIKQLMEVDK